MKISENQKEDNFLANGEFLFYKGLSLLCEHGVITG